MTARQCLALQIYVIAVVRYLETPTAGNERLLAQDARQLENAFACKPGKISVLNILDIPAPPPGLPDIL